MHQFYLLGLLPPIDLRQEVLLGGLLLLLWSDWLLVQVPRLLRRGSFGLGFGLGVVTSLVTVVLFATGWIVWAKAQVERGLDLQWQEQEAKTRPLLLPPPTEEVVGSAATRATNSLDVKLLGWTLETLRGQELPVADLEGNLLFINFWATWCAPCIAELPSIQTLIRTTKAEGRQVLFLLVTDEEVEEVQEFFRAREDLADLPVYLAHRGVPAELWFRARPTTYILNCDGMIVLHHTGPADWGAASVGSFLDRTIALSCEA